jgi:hypothetical protein
MSGAEDELTLLLITGTLADPVDVNVDSRAVGLLLGHT